MRLSFFGLTLLAPTLALAAGKTPQPADKHEPPVFADEGANWINVVGHDNDYVVKGAFRIYGAGSKNDRARFEWKQGGKVLASANCPGAYYPDAKIINVDCSIEEKITATGAIDADLIYVDDSNDTEYLVQTFHVTAKKWQGPGKTFNWGITPDDLLSVGYVRHWRSDTAFHEPLFEFWTTATIFGDATFRCTVDGKKIPDIDAHIDAASAAGQREIQVDVTTPNDRFSFLYEHVDVAPNVHFGSKTDHGLYDPKALQWLEDQPGKWDCFVRKDGHQIREFLFTVNDKGMIESSEMNKGAKAQQTLGNVVMVDMKIPADNGVEKRLRPDAMKKSIGFGTPWPDNAKVKEAHAAFPPATGAHD